MGVPVAEAEPRRKPRTLRWLLAAPPSNDDVAALAADLHLPEIVCRLLCVRGYNRVDPAKTFLRPRMDQLHDPLSMLDLDKGVERLVRAIRQKEIVMIHGDYDVDGICSTTLLTKTIRYLGGEAVP